VFATGLLALGAARLEASVADLELVEGSVRVRGVPGPGVSIGELVRGAGPLPRTSRTICPARPFRERCTWRRFEVDPDSGRVAVRDYTVVEDCGPMINPMIVEGQVHGAARAGNRRGAQRALVYDGDGQLLTGTLMDYAMPPPPICPRSRSGHLETPSPLTPGGYKAWGRAAPSGRRPPSRTRWRMPCGPSGSR
jgi:carbon-monoxide dehydrogenase large subunit